MININNKSWDKLRANDIRKFLSEDSDENFFIEFKSDGEKSTKLAKEISAFANTYGGYIFLGVNDDKTIEGCTTWDEQKIHSVMYYNISPVPNFDVRKFKIDNKRIYIIKIEEGTMPPYITNKGDIYERISSGSFPIKTSEKLSQLYYKRENQLSKLKEKIELESLSEANNIPQNIYGYIDIGFSVITSEPPELQKNFYNIDFNPISEYIKNTGNCFSISRIGFSYLIGIGLETNSNEKSTPLNAGINNFIEILYDGSVKFRILLSSPSSDLKVDISNILICVYIFKEIYKLLFGNDFYKTFICAHKYEKLTVLKQSVPYYEMKNIKIDKYDNIYPNYLEMHKENYGNNLIIESNRMPKNGYKTIDRRTFDLMNVKYDNANLMNLLFTTQFYNLGYIDEPPIPEF